MTRPSLRHTPLAAAVLLLAACANDPAAPLGTPDDAARHVDGPRMAATPTDEETDGWLVLLKEGTTGLAAAGKMMDDADVQPLQVRAGFVVRNIVDVEALRADPNVESVVPNTVYYKMGYPSTAIFWRRNWQWNMRQIRADQAAAGVTGAGRRVCVIDGGIDPDHQDLAGKVVAARAFPGTTPYLPEADFDGHGTHVASTVTSNGIGVEGVAPGALLMNANVFGPDAGTSVARIVDGMAWCVANGADVINMSLGGARSRGTAAWVSDSTTYTNATTAARTAGTVVIAAAGNSNIAIPSTTASQAFLPAEATGVVAVGATAPATTTTFPFAVAAPNAIYDLRAGYSNFNTGNDALGPGVRLYAPGGAGAQRSVLNVTAACASTAGPGCANNNAYFSISGTSMASPHVAGLAALVSSRTAGARSLARVEAIEACMIGTADPLAAGTPFFGRGRINVQRATTQSCPGL